jgi:DNA mismatch repair protein MutS2
MTLNKIQSKTLQDLEFQTVVSQIKENAITDLGKQALDVLVPFREVEAIKNTLKETSEYLASFDNDNRIPSHEFEAISSELKLLLIENTVLEQESFKRIHSICVSVNEHIKFFRKFKTYYPLLYLHTENFTVEKEIPEAIDKVFDKYGEIKNSASNELYDIRKKLGAVKDKINKSFSSALSTYSASDYLDDIRESVIENKRVLAVKSMYRKKVKGSVLGSSKTGSIVFIEPDASMQHNRTLNNLIYEEEQEIRKILGVLTDFMRPSKELLDGFQNYLVHMDYTAAKAKYAKKINALMPVIVDRPVLDFKKAYHPLLLVANNKTGAKTFPQDISLNESNRIVVISGPNAGGKSITLKTIGLLQLMLQSGILIPVHERSKACIFDRILTDIGDNQSIENHLSTYSYRLKNMNQFLKKCNHNTLFLIDEFGSGSDPELGGALAETFLEVFYEKGAYGVITTHYSNLKMLANELDAASNANMLFDPNSLEPTFQLMLGEAGSSFTFEVAQKMASPTVLSIKLKRKLNEEKCDLMPRSQNFKKNAPKFVRQDLSSRMKSKKYAWSPKNLKK